MARSKKSDKRRSKKTKVKVNFTGVETRKTLPEDDYKLKVEEVTKEKSDSPEGYLKWKFRTVSKNKKLDNAPLYLNTSLQPQALWNLRNLLEALGVETPDDEMDLDLTEMVDLTMIASTAHDDYEGKRRSIIVDFYNEDGDDTAEVDDDDDEDGDDGSTSYTADEVNEMDADELQELVDKHDLEINLKKHRSIKKKRAAVIEVLEEEELLGEEDDDDGDSDEEDDESYTADTVNEMDADELQELIDKHELDVNLKKHRSIKKKRASVVQALEDEDMIEDE